jgi:hypothetical protein
MSAIERVRSAKVVTSSRILVSYLAQRTQVIEIELFGTQENNGIRCFRRYCDKWFRVLDKEWM